MELHRSDHLTLRKISICSKNGIIRFFFLIKMKRQLLINGDLTQGN